MRIVKFTLKFLVGLMTGLILVGACVGALAIWYFGRDLPDYQQLTDYQPSIVSRVYAGDGRLLAQYATEKRVFVPVKEMPPLLIHAFLAAEDKNFYTHSGIDPLPMMRARVTEIMRIATPPCPVDAPYI